MSGIIEKYKEFIDIGNAKPISMGEGGTPLLHSDFLSKKIGADVFIKVEGCNPSWSFKDRGMVVAVCMALHRKKQVLVCASTGNTSASASAYAAKFGLISAIIVPNGNIAKGKLSQAMAFGAKIIAINGSFDDALNIVRKLEDYDKIEIVNSINPYRIEGQKSAAFEILDDIGEIDSLCIPVGNAGNITAYWKGFKEYNEKFGFKLPKMYGFQAEGASPIVKNEIVENPETIATAIRIGNPASWDKANEAVTDSIGAIKAVSDEEIIKSYVNLARQDGIFCEPASAAGIAGLIKYSKNYDFNIVVRIFLIYFIIFFLFLFAKNQIWSSIKLYFILCPIFFFILTLNFSENKPTIIKRYILYMLILLPIYKYSQFNNGIGVLDTFPSVINKDSKILTKWSIDRSKLYKCNSLKYDLNDKFHKIYISLLFNHKKEQNIQRNCKISLEKTNFVLQYIEWVFQ